MYPSDLRSTLPADYDRTTEHSVSPRRSLPSVADWRATQPERGLGARLDPDSAGLGPAVRVPSFWAVSFRLPR